MENAMYPTNTNEHNNYSDSQDNSVHNNLNTTNVDFDSGMDAVATHEKQQQCDDVDDVYEDCDDCDGLEGLDCFDDLSNKHIRTSSRSVDMGSLIATSGIHHSADLTNTNCNTTTYNTSNSTNTTNMSSTTDANTNTNTPTHNTNANANANTTGRHRHSVWYDVYGSNIGMLQPTPRRVQFDDTVAFDFITPDTYSPPFSSDTVDTDFNNSNNSNNSNISIDANGYTHSADSSSSDSQRQRQRRMRRMRRMIRGCLIHIHSPEEYSIHQRLVVLWV